MKAFIHFFFILGVVLMQVALVAQLPNSIEKIRPKELKQFGEGALVAGDALSAVTYLERYVTLKPKDLEGTYQLAEAYRLSRNYEKAEEWYMTAYEGDNEKYLKGLYYNGLMQIRNGKYEECEENLVKFRRKYKDFDDAQVFRKKVRIALESCQTALRLRDTFPNGVSINRLDNSVNHAHIEFAPLPLNDSTLIYASLRSDETIFQAYDDKDKLVRQFYLAQKSGDVWEDAGLYEAPFNVSDMDTGNGALSPDGNRFYFTRCQKTWRDKMVCSIYLSEKVDDKWQEPTKLDKIINDPKYTNTQPTVGIESFRNQEVLYFVSDRPEGKGGLDIWYSVYSTKKGTFSAPRNAGIRVNTAEDDLSPYYDFATKSLYFSTSGRPGMGGLDVFKATGEKSRWEDAVNVGYPINSSYDELYYVLNEDGETGFFTSNRPGGQTFSHSTCCDDIYAFEPGPIPPPVKKKPKDGEEIADDGSDNKDNDNDKNTDKDKEGFKIPIVEGTIVEESETGNPPPLSNVIVDLSKKETDGTTTFIRSFYTKTDGQFKFKLENEGEYELTAKSENHFTNTKIIVSKNDTVRQDIPLKPFDRQPIIIQNIYYEFDKSNLTTEAENTLDETLFEILRDNPAIIVEISSHTDSKGNDVYNQKLSQRRAESVVKHLIDKGVDATRLKAKGYGESKPIADNENADGSDNPDGRQQNRRTEFMVVGKLDQEIEYRK